MSYLNQQVDPRSIGPTICVVHDVRHVVGLTVGVISGACRATGSSPFVVKDPTGRNFTRVDDVPWLKRWEAVASVLQLQTFAFLLNQCGRCMLDTRVDRAWTRQLFSSGCKTNGLVTVGVTTSINAAAPAALFDDRD